MIGTYVKHPVYGVGKVIKTDNLNNRLVFFFKANKGLHNGGLYPGSCENHHGWWFTRREIADMEYFPPLGLLVERRQRQQWK